MLPFFTLLLSQVDRLPMAQLRQELADDGWFQMVAPPEDDTEFLREAAKPVRAQVAQAGQTLKALGHELAVKEGKLRQAKKLYVSLPPVFFFGGGFHLLGGRNPHAWTPGNLPFRPLPSKQLKKLQQKVAVALNRYAQATMEN